MHVAMRYLTPRHEAVDTFAWTRLQQEHARRSRAEQKRLLYVAFTRAQEHLVIGTCADGARELRALDDGRASHPHGAGREFPSAALADCAGGKRILRGRWRRA